MKRSTRLLASLLLCIFWLSSSTIQAQVIKDARQNIIGYLEDEKLTDSRHYIAGYIRPNGTVFNEKRELIGHFEKGGYVRDNRSFIVGLISDDGTVKNDSLYIIGHVTEDGIIRDDEYGIIGYAKNIEMRKAAIVFFFFKLLKLENSEEAYRQLSSSNTGVRGQREETCPTGWTWTEGSDGRRVVYPTSGWTWTEGSDGRRIIYPTSGWSWREDGSGRRIAYPTSGSGSIIDLLIKEIPLDDSSRPHVFLLAESMGVIE